MDANQLFEEKELLTRIAKGDEQAFSILFRREHPTVYSAALMVTANNALAEEVVQDVFLKIWLKRADLPQVQDFRSYLFIIARNQSYKVLKKQMRWLEHPEQADLADESIHLADLEETQKAEQVLSIFEEAVARLPGQQQRVFRMVKLQRMKRDQVADVMQISPETVKKYLAAAMLKIRAYCQANHPEMFLEVAGLVVLLMD